MKQVIRNGAGKYFVHNSGFVGTEATATEFGSIGEAQDQVSCLASVGISGSTIVQKANKVSYAVCYIRPSDINAVGEIVSKKLSAGWPSTPSPRRFATEDEAFAHGSRFRERRVNQNDKPGTCNHKGFYVIETQDPVNAAVNPKTGLTNSI